MGANFPFPELSPAAQAFFRTAYGVLLVAMLVRTIPLASRFFMSERWGGYAKSRFAVDAIQNPLVLPPVFGLWLGCGLLIAMGQGSVGASLVNLVLSWYFFIWMRWKGVLRGMGAPGFMTYWLAAALFLLEYTLHYAPQLRAFALLVLQLDFALIIFSSGFYKSRAGYLQNHGMELGLVNPQWGYWWKAYQKLPPGHWIFKLYNQLAWSGQLLAAGLMLIPETRFWGGLLLIVSFLVIVFNIRLLFLCPMMMLCGVLYFTKGSWGDQVLSGVLSSETFGVTLSTFPLMPAVNQLLGLGLGCYLLILPLAHAGLFYNFYGRRSLPSPFQALLERYTNFFGMIVWRVFSHDLVNFFIRIYRVPKRAKSQRLLVSRWDHHRDWRYRHVGEAITVTSLFTTLKYYPSQSELFQERLLRYARTIPRAKEEILIFEYLSGVKEKEGFRFRRASEFEVSPDRGTVEESPRDSRTSLVSVPDFSPVHEGAEPGSYRPLSQTLL